LKEVLIRKPEQLHLIVNPRAGHGRGHRALKRLWSAGHELGLKLNPKITKYPGHALKLAARVAQEDTNNLVVVMGGDGTIGEVANGLLHSSCILGIIAVGTGNDIARSLGLPLNRIRESLEIIQRGRVREIDVAASAERSFLSVMGVGFPVEVAIAANRIRGLRGPSVFFLAMYRSLLRMRSVWMEIRLDGRRVEGDFTSLLVQNTPYTGGGLLIAPSARMDDGFLDVITVGRIGKADLMVRLPTLYRGTHLQHSKFTLTKCKVLEVRSITQLPTMFDGDLYGSTPTSVEIKRKALRVIVR
jgi:YegS/Rv2252/BmrU family lipid kinase